MNQLSKLVAEQVGDGTITEESEMMADFMKALFQESSDEIEFQKKLVENGAEELATARFITEVSRILMKRSALSIPNRDPLPERKRHKEELDDEPVLGKVYQGTVANIMPYGAFVRLDGIRSQRGDGMRNKLDGLCHISNMGNSVRHPSEEVSLHQKVFVKITGVDGRKISLSMKEADQITGRAVEKAERGRSTMIKPGKRRLTSPERWELRQLIASGALSPSEYPEDEEANGKPHEEDEEVEVEIEVKTDEPQFLKGQTVKSGIELDPIRVIKNPEGSLNRSAMKGSDLMRERKEVKHNPILQPAMTSVRQRKPRESESSIDDEKKNLPIYAMRRELLEKVRQNQFLVIVGETGSGKTTQITQYLMEEGFDSRGVIACTQPRRVAAVSVAQRVAQEVGCKVGEKVGYTIRFEDASDPKVTRIKYMTDGMLQREALTDASLSKYSVVMLDEAHERTIATDVLFALLKSAALKRPDFRVIVTSATLDSGKFSSYFKQCPVLKIPGRTYPVDTLYTREPEYDYMSAALESVLHIHDCEPEGDILVFLTGQEEIETYCQILMERTAKNSTQLIVLPVYAALPAEMQSKIFEPASAQSDSPGARKCVVATNIAETSITIDEIKYVVDPGFVKINAYDPKLGMDSLIVSPISQAQANQRAGRAGRTGPGKCYRLYTENAYNTEMLPNTIPEIQRTNLSHTILMLKAMGINDLLNFEFMDPPPTHTMLTALEQLYTLGALNSDGYITSTGRRMADFPMDPAMAKTLFASVELGCSEEVVTILAMLSVQSVFFRPKDKQDEADRRKARFNHSYGDHLTLLNVYQRWEQHDFSRQWCQENFIHERSLKRVKEIRKQLLRIMTSHHHRMESCRGDSDIVRRAFCAGFFRNCAKRDSHEGCYKTLVEDTPVYMHPSSSLFMKGHADYVVYHTLLLTSKEYMHYATLIDPRWLVEVAPTFFKVADNSKKRNVKIQPLFDRFDKEQSWRVSNRR